MFDLTVILFRVFYFVISTNILCSSYCKSLQEKFFFFTPQSCKKSVPMLTFLGRINVAWEKKNNSFDGQALLCKIMQFNSTIIKLKLVYIGEDQWGPSFSSQLQLLVGRKEPWKNREKEALKENFYNAHWWSFTCGRQCKTAYFCVTESVCMCVCVCVLICR